MSKFPWVLFFLPGFIILTLLTEVSDLSSTWIQTMNKKSTRHWLWVSDQAQLQTMLLSELEMKEVLLAVYSADPALNFLRARSKLLHLPKLSENILSSTINLWLGYQWRETAICLDWRDKLSVIFASVNESKKIQFSVEMFVSVLCISRLDHSGTLMRYLCRAVEVV